MAKQRIDGNVALITGANRGIGRALALAMLDRGAAKVYLAARNPEAVADLAELHPDRVVPLLLDVTDNDAVSAAVEAAGDVRLVVNNAGVAAGGDLSEDSIVDNARTEMEVNYFAPLNLLSRFAPILARNGGGTVVNVSSIAGLSNFPLFPTYSASKAAIHSLTQGARALLAGQQITVLGVYPGPVDTDMAADVPMDKATPRDVANVILDGIESGREDIFPDAFAEEFARQFQTSPKESEQALAAMVAQA